MYDLSVIGGGWAGYTACIKAKQLGLSVSLIEENLLGGTCLNRGCIPTKSFIHTAKTFALIKKSQKFGIKQSIPEIDVAAMVERKNQVVNQLRAGMEAGLKGIDVFHEQATIISGNEVLAAGKRIESKYILIASGSRPQELKALAFDHQKILSSDDILDLKSLPNSILIIGGGVIGCEFASFFNALGVQVTLAEKMDSLLPGEDAEISRKLSVIFKKKGVSVETGVDASTIDRSVFDCVLVATGRTPHTQGMGLEALGLLGERNAISLKDGFLTSVPSIYAAGDCTAQIMLAHFASFQAHAAVLHIKNCLDKKPPVELTQDIPVPACIYTDPEIARIGLIQEQATLGGKSVDVYKRDFLSNGLARIGDETEGFIKVLVEQKTGVIIGASIIGPRATELINILSVCVNTKLNVSQLRNMIFPHPTLSEIIHDLLSTGH